jgi:hypothetical protein
MITQRAAPVAIAGISAVLSATQIGPDTVTDLKTVCGVFVAVIGAMWWVARWMGKVDKRLAMAEGWRESFDKRLQDVHDIVSNEFIATRRKRRKDGDAED